MCLVSIAWNAHPDYPLVFVGNRDEFHARPSAAADWWQDHPDILAGRDLEAGGSWLGVNRAGRFAVVTNRPDLPAPTDHARSRGELVTDWLTGKLDIDELGERHQLYGGFSLLLTEPGKLLRVSGGNGLSQLQHEELYEGVSGLSNTAIDQPWPKLTWLNAQLTPMVSAGQIDHEALLTPLLYEEPVAAHIEPWVAGLPFIRGEAYGTRSSSVVTISNTGICRFTERRFGPNGAPAGQDTFEFTVG